MKEQQKMEVERVRRVIWTGVKEQQKLEIEQFGQGATAYEAMESSKERDHLNQN